jgi:hypothetical protein
MAFKENLPNGNGCVCPPSEATDEEIVKAFRFVNNNPTADTDFHSHAELGKQRPDSVSECEWRSCSLFRDGIGALRRLPKLRNRHKYMAEIAVPKGAGLWTAQKNHVHFWMYDTFEPCKAVVSIEEIGSG